MQDEMDYSNFRLTREIDEDRLNQDTMNFMQKKGMFDFQYLCMEKVWVSVQKKVS